jgi:hypothetical protein
MKWILMKWILSGSRRGSECRRRRQPYPMEVLESRQLLATTNYTFVAPDLSSLRNQPDSTAAMFNRLDGALQAQIVLGPLAALKVLGGQNPPANVINPDQYVAAVENMVQGFESAAAQQAPGNRQLNQLVQLQGTALDAQTVVLNAKNKAGLDESNIPPTPSPTEPPGQPSNFYTDNLVTVEHLTLSRPLWPLGTPILQYINRTETFETDLTNAANAIPTLGIATAANLAHVEAASYVADINFSTLQRPGLDRFLSQQVANLLSGIDSAAQMGPSGAAAFSNAVATFTSATYNPTTGAGYLGPQGAYGKNFIQPTTANQVPAGIQPLNYMDVNTFQLGKYHGKQLKQTQVYHRNFGNTSSVSGDTSNEFGRFVTTSLYPNSAAAIRGAALDQTFLPPINSAFYVEDVKVGAGHSVYEGRVAPIYQGVLTPRNTLYPGLGPQIILDNSRAPDVVFNNQRTTGT